MDPRLAQYMTPMRKKLDDPNFQWMHPCQNQNCTVPTHWSTKYCFGCTRYYQHFPSKEVNSGNMNTVLRGPIIPPNRLVEKGMFPLRKCKGKGCNLYGFIDKTGGRTFSFCRTCSLNGAYLWVFVTSEEEYERLTMDPMYRCDSCHVNIKFLGSDGIFRPACRACWAKKTGKYKFGLAYGQTHSYDSSLISEL